MIYCNNLKKGDRVQYVLNARLASVECQPRETSAMVRVRFDYTNAPRYVQVMDLRLIVNGKAEDVPPCDGEPPRDERRKFKPRPPLKPIQPPFAGQTIPITFSELCTDLKVTPEERRALSVCLAVVRATAALTLGETR